MAQAHVALVIGESMQVEGTVGGAGEVEVRGQVRGKMSLDDHLWVAPGGRVDGELQAPGATVDGSLSGTWDIAGTLDVRAGAQVAGSLRADGLVLSDQASFDGEVDMPVELPARLLQEH